MSNISQFYDPDTGKLDATLIADDVADGLGRGLDGEMYEYRDGVYVRDPNIVTKRVAAALGARYSSSVLGQVEAHLLNIDLPDVGLPELPSGYLDYIVLQNGIYWWKDDALEDHSAGLGAMTKLPITHDPIAVPHSMNEWLTEVLGDDREIIRHMWEVIGYILMTGNPKHKIFLLHGPGGNGKSTMLRVLRAMLGRENYSSLSLHQLVEDRFATSSLYGKIANISGDLSSKYLADPQILKEISGGETISASRKFGHSFEFDPYAVPIFASNEFFRTSDTSDGWRRRWEVIDFTRKVDGSRPFDEQILFQEAPGIFNLAMEGLRRMMTRGRFDPPHEAIEATSRLHDSADPFMLWLEEDDNVIRGEDESAPSSDVYGRYSRWCRRNGYSALASGPFGMRLKQQGITRTRTRDGSSRTWRYQGISVMLSAHDD